LRDRAEHLPDRQYRNGPARELEGLPSAVLVSCPIALYPASSLSEKVSFNRINRKTGNRLKQQNVDAETGEVVPREDIARGYEMRASRRGKRAMVGGPSGRVRDRTVAHVANAIEVTLASALR
jgi:hypothetical protein